MTGIYTEGRGAVKGWGGVWGGARTVFIFKVTGCTGIQKYGDNYEIKKNSEDKIRR